MKIVLHILVHGIRIELMVNLYNVGASIIQKYIDIVCEILANKDKIYKIYIHLPTWQHLLSIIERFKDSRLVFNKLQVLLMVHMFQYHFDHPKGL
jgi:hypothetical protein